VKIDTSSRTATVSFDPEKANLEKLIGALEAHGFKVEASPQFLR